MNVREIVSTTTCRKHGSKRHGSPCWWLLTSRGLRLAICNDRARAAGATGWISKESLSRKKQEYNR